MRRERKFTETERGILSLLKAEGVMSKPDLIAKACGNPAYVGSAIRELLEEGYIYTLLDAGPLQQKLGVSNLDTHATHEWRWVGQYIEGEGLPGCAGPVMIEWSDASSAEKLEYWLAHFRRKCWFTLGNELEIIAMFEAREARRQAVGQCRADVLGLA
jgi:hypothetical protein